MKNVRFISRIQAERMLPRPSSVLISISNSGDTHPHLQEGWHDALYLTFDDIDEASSTYKVFSKKDAEQCLAFVAQHKHLDHLVVHCEKGQSRSAAVAIFFACLLNIECYKESWLINSEQYTLHNKKVYSTLYDTEYGPRGQAFL